MATKPTFQTAEEFEQWYAANSGVSVELLHKWGMRGAPCDCGDEICTGWQMLHEQQRPAPPDGGATPR